MTTYLWDFGDGATSTEQNPTHAYAAEGTYLVKLTVRQGIYGPQKVSVRTITVAGSSTTWTMYPTESGMSFWSDYVGWFASSRAPANASPAEAYNLVWNNSLGSYASLTNFENPTFTEGSAQWGLFNILEIGVTTGTNAYTAHTITYTINTSSARPGWSSPNYYYPNAGSPRLTNPWVRYTGAQMYDGFGSNGKFYTTGGDEGWRYTTTVTITAKVDDQTVAGQLTMVMTPVGVQGNTEKQYCDVVFTRTPTAGYVYPPVTAGNSTFNETFIPTDCALPTALTAHVPVPPGQGTQGFIVTDLEQSYDCHVTEFTLNEVVADQELAFIGVWATGEVPAFDPNNPNAYNNAVMYTSDGVCDGVYTGQSWGPNDRVAVVVGGNGPYLDNVRFFLNGEFIGSSDYAGDGGWPMVGFIPGLQDGYLQIRPNGNANGDMQYRQAYLDLIVAQGGTELDGMVSYWVSDVPEFAAPGATYRNAQYSNTNWRNVKFNTTNKTQFTPQGGGFGSPCCVVEFKLGPNYFVENSDPLYLGIQTISGSPNSGTYMVSQSGDQTMMYITSQGEFKIYGNENFGPINTSVTFGAGDVIGIVWSIDIQEGQNVHLFKNGISYASLAGMTIPVGSRSFSFCAGRVILA